MLNVPALEVSLEATQRAEMPTSESQIVHAPRRPKVKPGISGCEEVPEIIRAQIRMLESRGTTIELFRVGFRDQGLHVLVQRRSRIRGQDLIEGQRASQIHRIFDRGAYAFNRVCKKPENVEALSRDPFGTAVCHDLTLMLRRNWPAPHLS